MAVEPLEDDVPMAADVVVIGGGFAGIAAATRLAEAGAQVTLIEQKSFLGGRTYSITDRQTGDSVDNGQHVLMGCYHETFSLMKRLGTESGIRLQDSLHITYRGPFGYHDELKCSSLPGPLHLLVGLFRMKSIRWKEIGAALRFGWTLRNDQPVKKPETVSNLCSRLQQPEGLNRLMWNSIALSALNEQPDQADASLFITVLKQAFLGHAKDSRMALPVVALNELHGKHASRFIHDRGGAVHLNSRVTRVHINSGEITGVRLASGETIPCKSCISTVPERALRDLLKRSELSERISIPSLGTSPILSVYLWYERPISEDRICCLMDSNYEWVLHRSNFMNPGEHSQYCICLVASAARDKLKLSRQELIQAAIADIQASYPNTQELIPLSAMVFWDPHATFSATPENVRLRPGHQTDVKNFFLGGDWTDTGLPATIEGAVVSGHRCSELAERSI